MIRPLALQMKQLLGAVALVALGGCPASTVSNGLGEPCGDITCALGQVCFELGCRDICNQQSDCEPSEECSDDGICLPGAGLCAGVEDCQLPPLCKTMPSQCVAGRCEYADRICDDPPSDDCSTDNEYWLDYEDVGTCFEGECQYDFDASTCSDCINTCGVCKDVTCPDLNSGCRINGRCDPDTASCIYDEAPGLTTLCTSDEGWSGRCLDGDCMDCIEDIFEECDDPPGLEVCFTSACSGTTCAYTPQAGGQCHEAECIEGNFYDAATCDELGECNYPPQPCENGLQCVPGEAACLDSCSDDNHCVAGHYCQLFPRDTADTGYVPICEPFLSDGDTCYDVDNPAWCFNGQCCISKQCNPGLAVCGSLCNYADADCLGLTCDQSTTVGAEFGRCCLTGHCCDADEDCAAGYQCDLEDATCKLGQGRACTLNDECVTGHCTDGYCCDMACNGSCERCDGTALGECEAIESGVDADSCGSTESSDLCLSPPCECTTGGSCKGSQGADCAGGDGSNCATAACVDDYCCDTTCNSELCQHCGDHSALGPGSCSWVDTTVNTDPDGECATGGASCQDSCNTLAAGTGDCSGSGYFCGGTGAGVPVAEGMVCTGAGSTVPADADNNCLATETCNAGNCVAQKAYYGCGDSTGSCDETTPVSTEAVVATAGSVLDSTCQKVQSDAMVPSSLCDATPACHEEGGAYHYYAGSTCDGDGDNNSNDCSVRVEYALDGSEPCCDPAAEGLSAQCAGYWCDNATHDCYEHCEANNSSICAEALGYRCLAVTGPDNDVCQPGVLNDPCVEAADCDPDHLVCIGIPSGSCKLLADEACANGDDSMCAGYCFDGDNTCYDGLLNDPCDTSTVGQCQTGTLCSLAGYCKSDEGYPCSEDSDCEDGYCYSGDNKCYNGSYNGVHGDPCDNDAQCQMYNVDYHCFQNTIDNSAFETTYGSFIDECFPAATDANNFPCDSDADCPSDEYCYQALDAAIVDENVVAYINRCLDGYGSDRCEPGGDDECLQTNYTCKWSSAGEYYYCND